MFSRYPTKWVCHLCSRGLLCKTS